MIRRQYSVVRLIKKYGIKNELLSDRDALIKHHASNENASFIFFAAARCYQVISYGTELRRTKTKMYLFF